MPFLWAVLGNFQIARGVDGILAIGSGASVALGAMAALPLDSGPEVRIRRALEIAERHNAGVRGPFHVLCSSYEEKG